MKRLIQGLFLSIATLGISGLALANEYTDVIDAFDYEISDPFDINLLVGYERYHRSGVIRREAFDLTPHDWDYYAYRDMFEFKEVRHTLNLGLEMGLFRDLSLRVDLPLILNDQRELNAHDDQWFHDVNADGDSIDIFGSDFRGSFKSPDRSGVDYLSIGLWWGILDQGRDDTKPNWTFFAAGRFGVGEEMIASEAGNLNGGISRGLNEVEFGTRLSRRYGRLDPYFGLEALLGFPQSGTGYIIEGHRAAQLNKMPPMVGTLDFGLEFIAWEIPEKFVKLSLILGGGGLYHSEGRDYTPLFDALGVSPYFDGGSADAYEGPEEGYDFDNNGTPEMDPYEARNFWTGMTDVENYATFYGKFTIMMQPAKYVKFHIGTILGHETEHFITKTDQCRAGNMDGSSCSHYNRAYRPEIDDPGNRFRAERTLVFTFLLDAVAMF